MAVYFRKISENGNSVVVTDKPLSDNFTIKKFGSKELKVYNGSANSNVQWGIIAVAKEHKALLLEEARTFDPGKKLEGYEFTGTLVQEGKPVYWVV